MFIEQHFVRDTVIFSSISGVFSVFGGFLVAVMVGSFLSGLIAMMLYFDAGMLVTFCFLAWKYGDWDV